MKNKFDRFLIYETPGKAKRFHVSSNVIDLKLEEAPLGFCDCLNGCKYLQNLRINVRKFLKMPGCVEMMKNA